MRKCPARFNHGFRGSGVKRFRVQGFKVKINPNG
jgi:hypothetical protein